MNEFSFVTYQINKGATFIFAFNSELVLTLRLIWDACKLYALAPRYPPRDRPPKPNATSTYFFTLCSTKININESNTLS